MSMKRGVTFLVAMAMTLGTVTTVLAEEVTTTITLEDGDGCNASLTEASIDFGTWAWDGDQQKYVQTGTAPSGNSFVVNATSSSYNEIDTCPVTLSASALQEKDGTGVIADALLLGAQAQSDGTISVNVTPGTPLRVTVALRSAFVNNMGSYEPGIYQGDVTVTLVEAPGSGG